MSLTSDAVDGPRGDLMGTVAPTGRDSIHQMLTMVPRPVRFLGVGMLGLVTDLGVFTLMTGHGLDPLVARLVSLAGATVVTWRLNRAFTFGQSGRHQAGEAMRYAAVTAAAQGTSYLIFAALVITVCRSLPQFGLLVGAAVGAVVSYNGHRFFAFAPKRVAIAPRALSPERTTP